MAVLLLSGCGGGGLNVRECYFASDVVTVNDKNETVKAAWLFIRTRPEADTLDLKDVELVSRVEESFNARFFTTSTKKWIAFELPTKYATNSSGLRLRLRKSGFSTTLPDMIESKKSKDLDKP